MPFSLLTKDKLAISGPLCSIKQFIPSKSGVSDQLIWQPTSNLILRRNLSNVVFTVPAQHRTVLQTMSR
jgi:hypothetical protein